MGTPRSCHDKQPPTLSALCLYLFLLKVLTGKEEEKKRKEKQGQGFAALHLCFEVITCCIHAHLEVSFSDKKEHPFEMWIHIKGGGLLVVKHLNQNGYI